MKGLVEHLGGIPAHNIDTTHCIKAFKNSNFAVVKTKISLFIKTQTGGKFKIGKTGGYVSRAVNYPAFNKMYLLCQSRYPEIIDMLEAYYIQKYIGHKHCMNVNRGSASCMTGTGSHYYLYLVV